MASTRGMSFNDLISPVTVKTFFDTYHHRKSLHVPGAEDKSARVFSWDGFNEILNMDVWTPSTLQMVLNTERVPPPVFCQTTVNRNKQNVMQPKPDKVIELLRQGASLVLNEIETLSPGPGAVAETLKQSLNAKASANLYCSWRQRQAFDSHYDRHDVYAIQIVGEKRWRVYRGRADHPVEHPLFYNVPQAEYDRMKGEVDQEVTMTPGDLLYLPRGTFHDALASSDVSVHVTFSCAEALGLDWLHDAMERAVAEPLFRREWPRLEDANADAVIAAHLRQLLDRLQEIYAGPEGIEIIKSLIRRHASITTEFNLPNFDGDESYRVGANDWKVVRRGKSWVLKGASNTLDLEDGDPKAAEWLTTRSHFKLSELLSAFPADRARTTLARLAAHGVVERI